MSAADGTQIENFVASQQEVPIVSSDEGAPRVPFPTSYRLTRRQEDELVDFACQRLAQLEDELGRSSTGEAWFESADFRGIGGKSFLGRRQLYEMTYHNRVEWRPYILGGIFRDSNNLVVPISRRIVRQMIARANNYFFATDPWFAAYPVGVGDRKLAADIERYTRFKFDQGRQKSVLEKAVELAFVRGEAVVKTTFANKEQIYQQAASVLVDASGAEILGQDGDYILEDDLWVPETNEAIDPQSGQATQEPTGRMVLKRDGVTPKPVDMNFVAKLITRKITHYKGPESAVVYYRDFLCPLNAPSVQEADCVVHLYDMPVMQLADTYQRQGALDVAVGNEDALRSAQRAISMIRDMATEGGDAKAAKGKPRPELGESDDRVSSNTDPIVEIAEFHLRYDANGDGIMEDIMLVLDRKNRTPIFYDYTANITPDGMRPFDVVRVNEVDGRWHGIGAMEMFESSQLIVDLLVNRWDFSQSRAGRVDFWSPHNTAEGDSRKDLMLNWGSTYTLKPGKSAQDALSYVTLPDIKHDALQNMFQFFLQMATNESGVANANDARAAGLDTSELATGVRNIEKSGQEMFALYLSHLEPGLQGVIQRSMGLIFANMDGPEVFTFFEGDVQAVSSIDPRQVKDVDLNVSLLLTRYRGEQLLQSSMQAANLVTQFYSHTPDVQVRVAPLYRDMLKALQVSFADEIIEPMPPQMPQEGSVSGTAPGTPAVNPQQASQAIGLRPQGVSQPNL